MLEGGGRQLGDGFLVLMAQVFNVFRIWGLCFNFPSRASNECTCSELIYPPLFFFVGDMRERE